LPSFPASSATARRLPARQDLHGGGAGIMGYEMYRNGQQFFAGTGIVKKGVENTIVSVGRLGHDGMRCTDAEILKIMLDDE
jgi:hypothetical protein